MYKILRDIESLEEIYPTKPYSTSIEIKCPLHLKVLICSELFLPYYKGGISCWIYDRITSWINRNVLHYFS